MYALTDRMIIRECIRLLAWLTKSRSYREIEETYQMSRDFDQTHLRHYLYIKHASIVGAIEFSCNDLTMSLDDFSELILLPKLLTYVNYEAPIGA